MVEPPSRRALLLAALVLGLVGGTAACTSTSTGTTPARASAGAEELAVRGVIADAGRLRDGALLLSRQFPAGSAERALYTAIAADHLAHLVALGAPAPATATRTPGSTGSSAAASSTAASSTAASSTAASSTAASSTSGSSTAVPSSPTATSPSTTRPADQQAAEWEAAGGALRLGLDAQAGGLSQLLVRIAAARAAHADLIAAAVDDDPPGELSPEADAAASPSLPPSASASAPAAGSATPATTSATSAAPSPGSVLATPTDRALNRLLAGEHAAVYAYPVVIARTTAARRKLGQELWARHRYERDILTDRLLSAGIEPVAALPAYKISPIPGSPGLAVELAANLERGLAALAADVVATAQPGADRVLGADQLVLAARRTAGWAGRSDPLPGGTAPRVGTSATPTPSPSVSESASASTPSSNPSSP